LYFILELYPAPLDKNPGFCPCLEVLSLSLSLSLSLFSF
jgi:hypothetical protein